MLAADVGCDQHRVHFPDHLPGLRHNMRDVRAGGHVFRREPSVARAADVRHPRAFDPETGGGLFVEVVGNARIRALTRHALVVVAVEDRAPRIRVAVARAAPQHRQPDRLLINGKCHCHYQRTASFHPSRHSFNTTNPFFPSQIQTRATAKTPAAG